MLTREDILSNSEEVFRHYLGSLPVKRYITSPLRNDDTSSSFNLYYNGTVLYFKDWGGAWGNVIDFVMILNNCSFRQAIQDISSKGIKRVERTSTIPMSMETKISFIPFPKYTKTDIAYWGNINVSKELLIKENIISAKTLIINNTPNYMASENNPIYLYPITRKGMTYYKSYIPFAVKHLKFRNNYPDVSKFIHGLSTLSNLVDYIIITKSVKDELVLKSIGVNAISTQGEDVNINETVLRFLRIRYAKLFILYDCDYEKEEPYKFINKQAKKHNLIPIYIPLSLKVTDVAEMMAKHLIKTVELFLWKYLKDYKQKI